MERVISIPALANSVEGEAQTPPKNPENGTVDEEGWESILGTPQTDRERCLIFSAPIDDRVKIAKKLVDERKPHKITKPNDGRNFKTHRQWFQYSSSLEEI